MTCRITLLKFSNNEVLYLNVDLGYCETNKLLQSIVDDFIRMQIPKTYLQNLIYLFLDCLMNLHFLKKKDDSDI